MQQAHIAGRWLSTVHRYSYIFLSKTFAEYGIGQGQIKFLMILFEQDGVTQEHMAGELNIDKATVARAIRKLETEDYVIRKPHESDRRANLIFLTDKAKGIESVIKKEMTHWTETLTHGFSDEERQTAIELLKRMAGNAVKEVESMEEVKSNETAE